MSEPAELRASTRFCAVFGHPVRHSASPAMHNPALAALGLDWRYLACDVHPDRLREAIAGAQAMKFIGLNLTIPHKLLAVDLVEAGSRSAQAGSPATRRLRRRRFGVQVKPPLAPRCELPV